MSCHVMFNHSTFQYYTWKYITYLQTCFASVSGSVSVSSLFLVGIMFPKFQPVLNHFHFLSNVERVKDKTSVKNVVYVSYECFVRKMKNYYWECAFQTYQLTLLIPDTSSRASAAKLASSSNDLSLLLSSRASCSTDIHGRK